MWTLENRDHYNRRTLRYPSELTDAEWALIEPSIPPAKRGGNKRAVDVRDVINGKPVARGLEFGTTGLHQPVGVQVAKGKIFGRSIYAYIDAGQTVTRSYAAFLFKIPSDYRGVERITYASGRLTLHERSSGPARDLVMAAGDLFGESALGQ